MHHRVFDTVVPAISWSLGLVRRSRRRLPSPTVALATLACSSLVLASGCTVAVAQTPRDEGAGFWRILDTRAVGAEQHRAKHPTEDGRGAVIAVLDTGVDMGRPGLKSTSDGKPKVIEARDFSGQGEVILQVATVKTFDGVKYLSTDDGKVRGFESLAIKAPQDEWFVGFLSEARFANSDVTDVNQNGSTQDKFAVIAVPDTRTDEGGWVAYVDLDGNGDITGATPMQSYSVAHKPFTFPVRDPEYQRPPVTFALEIDESGTIVTFHFDDGGHGTHVAGIAAGYGLMGRKGFDGIAPGAQILSLKIGDNTLSGGATTTDSMYRAIDYAGKWSKKHNRAVIINISYGIGSEIEGESAIDAALDAALTTYPLLSASVSAGNEGPGLSTVGTPAASQLATTVAAMLPRASSEALFGRRFSRDRVFSFSSRGGETPKPDILAPGIASSSVPAFDDGDIKGGTSMAAPEITGVYALMVSAATARNIRFNGSTLKRALLHSARPLPEYTLITQGAGVPDVGRAIEALAALGKREGPFRLAGYDVSTEVPTSESRMGQAAYWRTGTYLPPDDKGHNFRIEPLFRDRTPAADRSAFQTMLAFRSEANWLRVDRRSGRLIGDQGLDVNVTYDERALKTPGVYSGRVLVTPDDSAGIPAFALWNTVVVPYTFTADNGYHVEKRGETLEPGTIRRYPVLVPPGATSMTIDFEVPKGSWGSTVMQLYDPAGRPFPVNDRHASSEYGTSARALVEGRDLTPGVWEVIAYGSWRNRKDSRYDVDMRFRGLEAQVIRNVTLEAGELPRGRFSVTNRYDMPFDGSAAGRFIGFRRVRTPEVDDDTWEYTFELSDEYSQIDFDLRLTPRTYNRFTDIAATILDGNGNAVVKDGFGIGVCRFTFRGAPGTYTLKVVGGKARSGGDPWPIRVEETWVRRRNIGIMVGGVTLYPNVETKVNFTMSESPPRSPNGFYGYGEIIFTDTARRETWLKVPMVLP